MADCWSSRTLVCYLFATCVFGNCACGIRFRSAESAETTGIDGSGSSRTAVFALGSFWRGEAVFGCLPGVQRTRVGYCGGSKLDPDYHNVGDHAEAVEVEFDSSRLRYEQLLDVFWANHDPTQTFGQGPDVGDQYRSVIFVQGEEEAKLAGLSKRREQVKLLDRTVLTEIQPLVSFYPAEMEHQKFALRRKSHLLQLLGDLSDEDLLNSVIAAKLNGYAADTCPLSVQKLIDTKVRPMFLHRPKLLGLFGDEV